MGLPNLQGRDLKRVTTDNAASEYALSLIKACAARGGGSFRENPANSLRWWCPSEQEMWETCEWSEKWYSACAFQGARCKQQLLRRNLPEIDAWPVLQCRHIHADNEWKPYKCNGMHVYPSHEEAEYTASLALSLAITCSWWAARKGFAVLKIHRLPPVEVAGDRRPWLELDPRAVR